ncbi:MAG: LapA family protein [Pseudomonadaceae bacterium]|nr:LapA family protein [Pseudomonadaceae bacterium]
MTWLKRLCLFIVVVIVVLTASLAVNQTEISLQFLTWQTPVLPAFWWLLAAFLLGSFATFLLVFVFYLQGRWQQRRLKKEVSAREQEIAQLRGGSADS